MPVRVLYWTRTLCSWSHAGTWINRYRKYYCRAAAKVFWFTSERKYMWYQCGTPLHFCPVCRQTGKYRETAVVASQKRCRGKAIHSHGLPKSRFLGLRKNSSASQLRCWRQECTGESNQKASKARSRCLAVPVGGYWRSKSPGLPMRAGLCLDCIRAA